MLLSLKSVSKSFGALTVTNDLSLDMPTGQALGILGPNGAGKSTMFNLITGDIKPNSGMIWFDGEDISALPVQQRCKRGIGRSYQIPHPFGKMTVFENLLVAAEFGSNLQEDAICDHCAEILEITGLLERANDPAGSLTLLQRKRLELARALATKPKLLLLDEIAGGLTEGECHELVDCIKTVRQQGVSIIWIEHVVHALLSVVDRLAVINFGELLIEGEPDLVMNNPKVQEIYMGGFAE
ncbi:MAG: ABC transporter ATP-binding protein [Alphaproteobacteria bacterium]|nr:ABC transporter ATP-binding protein [Alphaproteobacteria bacterium]